ncbi:MAG: ATPase domain-containing protein [Fodinibius sp.]|nr:ATPase domain-containing protein [Fodinibius sp.]
MIETGKLEIMSIEPLSYSPDEFTKIVRTDVEENGTQIVMIDSIGGYNLAIRKENMLERLHALTVYLQNMGVTSLLLNEAQEITGQFRATKMNASYLADNILFLRYLEINGQLRKSIGVLKKRLSDFEKSIREYRITPEGIKIGQPLENMRGILSGNPELTT